MCLLMHLFFTARDTTSHALGTIASAMGPCGVLGALGTSIAAYLLLQLVMGLRATVLRDILLVRLPSPWMHSASPPVLHEKAVGRKASADALGRCLYKTLVAALCLHILRRGRGFGWRMACKLSDSSLFRCPKTVRRLARMSAYPSALGACLYKILVGLNTRRICRGVRRGRHVGWRLFWFSKVGPRPPFSRLLKPPYIYHYTPTKALSLPKPSVDFRPT